ncbi:MAG: isocitrate/isopropylmalate family dehydrogenase, partial [Solimonas sp.]
MNKKILILPGDGIGPEIMAEAVKVLEVLRGEGEKLEWSFGHLGGAAYD